MPTAVVAVRGHPQSASRSRGPAAIACKFVGVIKLPPTPDKEEVALEVYRHPNGRYFAVDERGAIGPALGDLFSVPAGGNTLDLSDEPRDRLLEAKACRFLST